MHAPEGTIRPCDLYVDSKKLENLKMGEDGAPQAVYRWERRKAENHRAKSNHALWLCMHTRGCDQNCSSSESRAAISIANVLDGNFRDATLQISKAILKIQGHRDAKRATQSAAIESGMRKVGNTAGDDGRVAAPLDSCAAKGGLFNT